MRSPLRVALVAAVTTYLLMPRHAAAGCLNLCELSLQPAVIEPESDCLIMSAVANDCDCGVSLALRNRCAGTVVATDFTFDTCELPGQRYQDYSHDCDTVATNGASYVFYRLNPPPGPHDWSLHLQRDVAEYSVRMHAVVSSFESEGCACRSAVAGGRQRPPLAPLVGLGLLAVLRARRNVKRGPERRRGARSHTRARL